MGRSWDYDVAIVGGGVVGVTLAAILGRGDLRVAIVEAQPLDQARHRHQAYALSLLSSEIFQGLGLWADLWPTLGPYRQIHLSDVFTDQPAVFTAAQLERPFLGFTAPHHGLFDPLYRLTQDQPHLDWFCPATLNDRQDRGDHQRLVLGTAGGEVAITCGVVVGADGSQSPLRESAQMRRWGWHYGQACVAFTLRHQAPRNDIAFERFRRTGPMGVLPLPGNRCQIVWTQTLAEAQRLTALPAEAFLAFLRPQLDASFGEIALDGDRRMFPVQLRQSWRYVQHRLALVGDAAHCCHPVGGQGLNMGIRDAAALAQVLLTAHRQGEDVGEVRVLRRYQRWRQGENLVILAMTDSLDRLFSAQVWPLVWLRRIAVTVLGSQPWLQRPILQLMTGLRGRKPVIAQGVTPHPVLKSP